MIPMHLGLINGPFVPHNLISTQESPVPLLKFEIAPRLKIFNDLWVQERTPDIHFLISQKSQQMKPLQVPQTATMKREARLQGICISLKNFIFRVPQ